MIVQSKEEMEHHIKVCYSCYFEKNFPVVLGLDDFVKKSLMEEIEEVDFDKRYGKKKNGEFTRMAEAV